MRAPTCLCLMPMNSSCTARHSSVFHTYDRSVAHVTVCVCVCSDWRNLTLYSPKLDFSGFRGAPGQAVWYL